MKGTTGMARDLSRAELRKLAIKKSLLAVAERLDAEGVRAMIQAACTAGWDSLGGEGIAALTDFDATIQDGWDYPPWAKVIQANRQRAEDAFTGALKRAWSKLDVERVVSASIGLGMLVAASVAANKRCAELRAMEGGDGVPRPAEASAD